MPIRHTPARADEYIVEDNDWNRDHTLPTEAELAAILDTRYVERAGDTMLGNLDFGANLAIFGASAIEESAVGILRARQAPPNAATVSIQASWVHVVTGVRPSGVSMVISTFGAAIGNSILYYSGDGAMSQLVASQVGGYFRLNRALADNLDEITLNAGVTIDGVLLKDNEATVDALNLPDDGWGSDAVRWKTVKLIEVAGILRLCLHDESAYSDIYMRNITFMDSCLCLGNSVTSVFRPATGDGRGQFNFQNFSGAAWLTCLRLGTAGVFDPAIYIPRLKDLEHLTGAWHHTLPDTRPAAPNVGDIRYNAPANILEVWDGAVWQPR